MKKVGILLLSTFLGTSSFGQTQLSGTVTDASTGEALIGATIVYGKGKGTATDIDGNYSIAIHSGERSIQVSYVGYKQINKTITITQNSRLELNKKKISIKHIPL